MSLMSPLPVCGDCGVAGEDHAGVGRKDAVVVNVVEGCLLRPALGVLMPDAVGLFPRHRLGDIHPLVVEPVVEADDKDVFRLRWCSRGGARYRHGDGRGRWRRRDRCLKMFAHRGEDLQQPCGGELVLLEDLIDSEAIMQVAKVAFGEELLDAAVAHGTPPGCPGAAVAEQRDLALAGLEVVPVDGDRIQAGPRRDNVDGQGLCHWASPPVLSRR
jgi:hypothetical protein